MSESRPGQVTQLLQRCRSGDRDATRELGDLVYEELHRIAARTLFVGRAGDTLQPTALVSEAWIAIADRLELDDDEMTENSRVFYRTVAWKMRDLLREHHRRGRAIKRGGGIRPILLGPESAAADDPSSLDREDFLALDAAITALERAYPDWYETVALRLFAGRTIEQTALLMDVGVTTVKQNWVKARAWLRREIIGSAG